MRNFALALVIFISTFSARADEPSGISLNDLREKYSDDGTHFVNIDGVDVHYRDEGQGPVVVLLHASFFNLKTWDQLAETLQSNYRVIRLDFPNMGLSGPETKEAPGGKYNFTERQFEIVSGFINKLNLNAFSLIATSSGGSVGFRYASRFPNHVSRLILINSAGMPRSKQTDPNRNRADIAKWQAMRIKPREYWDYSVNLNFPSEAKAPETFIDLAYDLNRRDDTPPFSNYIFETGDPQSILSKIQAPTLIMWGMENPTVMHLEADVIEHWMTSAPTLIKKYEGLGHYPYIEAPELVIPDIADFLGGRRDDELRVTQRVKVGP